jgi:prefoldin subunit 5
MRIQQDGVMYLHFISTDFSEWAIGHLGSSYYIRSDKEKYSLFKRCEPFLTYLDQRGLEQKQTDLQSRLETMERENERLRIQTDKIEKVMSEIEQVKKRIGLA